MKSSAHVRHRRRRTAAAVPRGRSATARSHGTSHWCASCTRRGGTRSTRPSTCTASSFDRNRKAGRNPPRRHAQGATPGRRPDRSPLPTVPEAQLREDQSDLAAERHAAGDASMSSVRSKGRRDPPIQVRRFLTRSDPQSLSVFPTNAGFLGDFAESGTGSKPGARRTSSSSSTCSTVHSAGRSRRARYDHDPREPESDSGLADGMVHEADGRAELYLAWPAAPGCSSRPLPLPIRTRLTSRPWHILARAGLCTPRPSRRRR